MSATRAARAERAFTVMPRKLLVGSRAGESRSARNLRRWRQGRALCGRNGI
jgi:hypothetical protein